MTLQDLSIVPQPDGFLYALGAPTTEPTERVTTRFLTQFLSAVNEATGRGAIFIDALAAGDIRTNADVTTLVATAAAQIRALERQLSFDVVLEGVDILSVEFIDLRTLRMAVRLNSSEGTVVNDIVVTA